MYWIRSANLNDLLFYLLLCLFWLAGGWLLATHTFRLKAAERLIAGIAIGLLLFIGLSNLLANVLPLTPAYGVASGLVFLLGNAGAWHARNHNRRQGKQPSKAPWLDIRDWKHWQLPATLLVLSVIFTLIGRGLALFDDYLHLPLISVMAADDMPPHFYLNPEMHFAYHYGLHVLAASLVRLGGFFPWSAWDLCKALAIALTLALAWLWLRRLTRSLGGAGLGSFLLGFAGGARWLLLLVPLTILHRLSSEVRLSNSALSAGADLVTALASPWPVEGSGAMPFPFAYHNGVFSPVIFALGSSGALPYLTILLLLLLTASRRHSAIATLVLSLLFATLALSAEHIFVLLWISLALCALTYLIHQKRKRAPIKQAALFHWTAILAFSGLLSAIQGGFLTEAVRNIILRLQGIASTTGGTYNYFSFSFRWPPGLDTAHFGELSILNIRQLLVLLAELGPALLLAPLVTWYAIRRVQRRNWMIAGLGIAAALSFLLSLFFKYGVERSGTRLPAASLWIWVLLGFPPVWRLAQKVRTAARFWLGLGYATTVFGGVVIFAIQATAIPAPQLTYFVKARNLLNPADAWMSRDLWNRLPEKAEVFDPIPYRSVTLFGRPSKSSLDFYHPLPEWEELLAKPDPVAIARAGYAFIYVDRKWWQSLKAEQRAAFQQPCILRYAEKSQEGNDFRWLLDIRSCRP